MYLGGFELETGPKLSQYVTGGYLIVRDRRMKVTRLSADGQGR